MRLPFMRSVSFAALLTLSLAGCRALPTLPEKPVMENFHYKVDQLIFPSGLRVVLDSDRRSPTVAVALVVSGGTAADPAGKEGLAHLVEHLTYRARATDARTVNDRLEQLGASRVNAETRFDTTLFYAQAPVEQLDALLALEGHRLAAPLEHLRSDDFTRERDVVLSEIRERNEDGHAAQILSWVQEASFPPSHPYSRAMAGTPATLGAATLDDARAYARTHYKPSNATLVIVGDFDLQTIKERIRNALPEEVRQGSGNGAIPVRLPAARDVPLSNPRPVAQYESAVQSPELWMSWTLPQAFGALAPMLEVVSGVAEDLAAGAEQKDRDIESVETALLPGAQGSLLVVRARLREVTNPNDVAHRIAKAVEQLGYMGGGGAGRDYVMARLKIGMVTAAALNGEDLVERAQTRALYTHFMGDPAALNRAQGGIIQLRADQIGNFAHAFLTAERSRAVLVMPRKPQDARAPLAAGPASQASLLAAIIPPIGLERAPGAQAVVSQRFENGLELLVLPRHEFPLTTTLLLLPGGKAVGAPGASALAGILADTYDERRGSPFEVAVHTNRFVSDDAIEYVMRGGSGNTVNMLGMIAERVTSVRATDIDLDLFRDRSVPVLRRWDARPEAQAEYALEARLFPGHPYSQPATTEVLAKVSAADLRAWIERTHQPTGAVLVVVGDVDPKVVAEQALAFFGDWKAEGPAVTIAPAPAPRGGDWQVQLTDRKDDAQARLALGCQLPAVTSANWATGTVAAALFEQHLQRVLREALGASYGVHAALNARRGGVVDLSLETSVDQAKLPTALATARATVAAFAAGTFEPNEVEHAKLVAASDVAGATITNLQWARRLAEVRNLGLSVADLDALPAALAKVEPEALKGLFAACAAAPVVVQVTGDAAALRPAIGAPAQP